MLVYSHKDCLEHLTPEGHPERSARLDAVARGLEGLAVERRDCPMGDEAEVLRCHPASYLAKVKATVPREGLAALDGDTWLSPGSHRAALRAVGGMAAAVDAVLAGEDSAAFVAARPPGHHAERERAMGFCLYGTAAIGVKRALDHHGLSRVAIVDFDVHHGNGTQEILWDEPRALYISSHQHPLYPGTGLAEERGGNGTILNVPLPEGCESRQFRFIYRDTVLPALDRFRPQLLLVSAGFDAHRLDPLAGLNLGGPDFEWLTLELVDIARRHAGGRVVSALEGGYSLTALRECCIAHVRALH